MAGRKRKTPPAELKTIGLFNGGLTPIEEAEQLVRDEAPQVRDPVDRTVQGTRDALVRSAIRWLGLDIFAGDGDDLILVEGPEGKGAVLQVLYAGRTTNVPRKTIEIRLNETHLQKLKEILS